MHSDLGRRLITGGIEIAGDEAPGEGRQRIQAIPEDATRIRFATVGFTATATYSGINFIIDGGGAAITTGVKGDIVIPFGTRIEEVELLADQSGSIKIDIFRDTYGQFPPTNADTITGGDEPEISSGTKWSSRFDLTGGLVNWEREIKRFDILRVNVDSVTTIQRVTLAMIFINDLEFTPVRERVTS